MQVKRIVECSNGLSLSYHFLLRPLFCLFLSGRLRHFLTGPRSAVGNVSGNFIVTSSRRNPFLSSIRITRLVRNATGTRICAKTSNSAVKWASSIRWCSIDARPQADKTKLDEGTSSLDQTAVESNCFYGRISLCFEIGGRKISCTCLEARW